MDRIGRHLRNFFMERIVKPSIAASAHQIGLSVAVGIWGGIFPVPAMATAVTVFLCTIVLFKFFNSGMTTIAVALNVLLTPIQLVCMPLFMDLPHRILGFPACSVESFMYHMNNRPFMETIRTFGSCMIWAVVTWSVLALPLIFIVAVTVGRVVQKWRSVKRD
jgi:hypothetical protein